MYLKLRINFVVYHILFNWRGSTCLLLCCVAYLQQFQAMQQIAELLQILSLFYAIKYNSIVWSWPLTWLINRRNVFRIASIVLKEVRWLIKHKNLVLLCQRILQISYIFFYPRKLWNLFSIWCRKEYSLFFTHLDVSMIYRLRFLIHSCTRNCIFVSNITTKKKNLDIRFLWLHKYANQSMDK